MYYQRRGDTIILILMDSLRNDAISPLKGIFKNETWGSYQTIEAFTAPVLASTWYSKTPEDLGMTRTDDDFSSPIPNAIPNDKTLFSGFDSWVTIGRLEGNGPTQMPPSRRNKEKFLPPIPWNAQSNWDPDIFNYVGAKWSCTSTFFPDLIFWHSFTCHGPFSSFTGEGHLECPEMKTPDKLMMRFGSDDRKMGTTKLRDWYMKGVYNAAASLRAIQNITQDVETVILFADHGEALGELLHGEPVYGHRRGMLEIPEVSTVPIFINRDEEIPEDINNLNLRDWVWDMHQKWEVENEQYQEYKQNITKGEMMVQPGNWNMELTPEDELRIKERLKKLGYLSDD